MLVGGVRPLDLVELAGCPELLQYDLDLVGRDLAARQAEASALELPLEEGVVRDELSERTASTGGLVVGEVEGGELAEAVDAEL